MLHIIAVTVTGSVVIYGCGVDFSVCGMGARTRTSVDEIGVYISLRILATWFVLLYKYIQMALGIEGIGVVRTESRNDIGQDGTQHRFGIHEPAQTGKTDC
eukprot:TRINITY_DN6557_c0_g1::TRINITY_DN6557_c0_g1_i1::g.13426::m.13426 TRINITY_DN6557_c0_g1::TRINITY_DN6557_c0_g1_i1::g.13426  ORF type:complete len:101 (-),score=-3.91,DUF1072/PF06380.6/0.63 TRINITY_DN6557_c0_g1_i1:20-322(-)